MRVDLRGERRDMVRREAHHRVADQVRGLAEIEVQGGGNWFGIMAGLSGFPADRARRYRAVNSSGKCRRTDSSGLAAAWPRPQIEASVMAADSFFEQRFVPGLALHQLDRLLRADAAGRALAAALVLEKTA